MTFQHHDEIAGTLDRVKGTGLISEYLVSWRGRGGELEPRVVVWSEAAKDTVRGRLARLLLGRVPPRRIMVVDDEAETA